MLKEKAENSEGGQLGKAEVLVGTGKDEQNVGHSSESGENGFTLWALHDMRLLCKLVILLDTESKCAQHSKARLSKTDAFMIPVIFQ